MNAYVYCWNLQPEDDIALQVRVKAPSVSVARRTIRRFLVAHDGVTWTVECISRTACGPADTLRGDPNAEAEIPS